MFTGGFECTEGSGVKVEGKMWERGVGRRLI